jgi:hypothetical protein
MVVKLPEFLGRDPIFAVPMAPGVMRLVSVQVALPNVEPKDVADEIGVRVLGVPVPGDRHGVILGQYRVEDRLPDEAGREALPPGIE